MASRSKCAQFFALLFIALMLPTFVMISLILFYTFPIEETLQAIGIENEGALWGKPIFINAGSIDLLGIDLFVIFSATVYRKVQFEECKWKRETIGPFLFGFTVISRGVS